MAYRLFISFATGDDDNVAQLNNSLSRLENVEVYIPNWIVVEDKNMGYKVKEGLDSSRVVIVFITFNSTNTVWINQQIGYAFAKNIPVILIVEKGIDVKGFLEGSDFITYQRGNFKHNIYQVISKLRTMFPQYLLETSIENFLCYLSYLQQKVSRVTAYSGYTFSEC
jgi:TIR domain